MKCKSSTKALLIELQGNREALYRVIFGNREFVDSFKYSFGPIGSSQGPLCVRTRRSAFERVAQEHRRASANARPTTGLA